MKRWFIGVKADGTRRVFAESAGADPVAAAMGFANVFGPYQSEKDASTAAKGKQSVHGGSLRKRPKA